MDLKTNTPICNSYVSAMRAMGHSTEFDNTGQVNTLNGGSTDMGILHHEPVQQSLIIRRKHLLRCPWVPRNLRHRGRRRQSHSSIHRRRRLGRFVSAESRLRSGDGCCRLPGSD
jgi:hypothetical protein